MSTTNTFTSGSDPLAAAGRAADLVRLLTGREPVTDQDAPAAIATVMATHGEPDFGDLAPADVLALRQAAGELRTVFEAGTVTETAHRLNDLLRRYAGPPRLTDHGETAWHIHVDDDDDDPLGAWLITSSAWALAVLLASHQRPPVGICSAPDCTGPYLAVGRGRIRHYCSTQCATRVRVAAHRRERALGITPL